MEDGAVKVKKKSKAGPLKSSPGFLKCMRSVYLYFKEEKEKGALNIPINSFIERTAVACGVGRKTLYNYAKKGLFDEHPTLLQPKKRIKKKAKHNTQGSEENVRVATVPVTCSEPVFVKKKIARSVQVQTQTQPFLTTVSTNNCIATSTDASLGDLIVKDEKSVVRKGNGQEVGVPWTSGNSTRREIDYFSKTNMWHNIYSIQTTDVGVCSTELTPSRMTNCQQTSPHLTDL